MLKVVPSANEIFFPFLSRYATYLQFTLHRSAFSRSCLLSAKLARFSGISVARKYRQQRYSLPPADTCRHEKKKKSDTFAIKSGARIRISLRSYDWHYRETETEVCRAVAAVASSIAIETRRTSRPLRFFPRPLTLSS